MRIRTFFICFAILIIRGWDRLWHAGIWAEDGKVFLSDALTFGWSSLLDPYSGYFHLVGRLATLIFSAFSIEYFPHLITLFCILIYAGVMSTFSDKSYRHLVESDQARVFIAAGFCLVPGGHEVIGNLCNMHRVLTPYLLFLGLRTFRYDIKPLQILITFLVAGSAGEAFVTLPLFFYRGFKRFKTDLKFAPILPEIAIIIIVSVWTLLDLKFRVHYTAVPWTWSGVWEATLASYTSICLMEPIVGWRLSMNLWTFVRPLYWVVSGGLSLLLIKDLWRSRYSEKLLIYVGFGAQVSVLVLTCIARPGTMDLFKTFAPGYNWWNMREGFGLAFASYFLWSLYFGKRSKKAGIAYVLIYFILSPSLHLSAYGEVDYWWPTASRLEKSRRTGCPRQVEVRFFPWIDHWAFTYISPKALDPHSPPCTE